MVHQVTLDEPEASPLTGADLRSMHKRAGITQDELARRFGCDRTTIVRWERGHRYRAGHEHVNYAIPAPLRVQLLLVIAEVQAERRKADQEIGLRVQRLARA